MLPPSPRLAVVGAGRLGGAMTAALREAGLPVAGPLGRGASAGDADVVLLCVPDAAIAEAAARVAPGRLVGHCSGATTLAPLAPHEAFSVHPLMSVPDATARFAGVGAAVAGSTARALEAARWVAERLGMRAVTVRDEDRALYHAAASAASNYVVTLGCVAEAMAARAGVPRELLAPLARAAVEQWAARGAAALTGPIARGDEETVRRQRAAVAERVPDAAALWDALAGHARTLAATGHAVAPEAA